MSLLEQLGGDEFIDYMAGAELGEKDYLLGIKPNHREYYGYRGSKSFAEGYMDGYKLAEEEAEKEIAECEKLYAEGKLR